MVCAASTNGPTVASGRIGNLFVFRKGGIADAGVKPSPGPPPSRRPKLIRPGSREGPGRRLGTPPRKDRLPHLKSQMDTLNVHLTFQFTVKPIHESRFSALKFSKLDNSAKTSKSHEILKRQQGVSPFILQCFSKSNHRKGHEKEARHICRAPRLVCASRKAGAATWALPCNKREPDYNSATQKSWLQNNSATTKCHFETIPQQ